MGLSGGSKPAEPAQTQALVKYQAPSIGINLLPGTQATGYQNVPVQVAGNAPPETITQGILRVLGIGKPTTTTTMQRQATYSSPVPMMGGSEQTHAQNAQRMDPMAMLQQLGQMQPRNREEMQQLHGMRTALIQQIFNMKGGQ